MAELADAADSKSADLRVLGVRLPLPAPQHKAQIISRTTNPTSTELMGDNRKGAAEIPVRIEFGKVPSCAAHPSHEHELE
jgi:hypothetical protein